MLRDLLALAMVTLVACQTAAPRPDGVTLGSGSGAVVPAGRVPHAHAEAANSQWYFASVRPAGTPAGHAGEAIFRTRLPALPASDNGEQGERGHSLSLRLVQIVQGILLPRHRPGGVEVLVVIDGEVEVQWPDGTTRLRPDEGTLVAPGTVVAIKSVGFTGARLLALYVTPAGLPLFTELP